MGYDQTFAAVIKPMAFRVLFAIAAYYDLVIDQMDVKIALLYGLIDQLIYVEMPETNATRNIQYGGYLYPVGLSGQLSKCNLWGPGFCKIRVSDFLC